jgi:hypothetical protein
MSNFGRALVMSCAFASPIEPGKGRIALRKANSRHSRGRYTDGRSKPSPLRREIQMSQNMSTGPFQVSDSRNGKYKFKNPTRKYGAWGTRKKKQKRKQNRKQNRKQTQNRNQKPGEIPHSERRVRDDEQRQKQRQKLSQLQIPHPLRGFGMTDTRFFSGPATPVFGAWRFRWTESLASPC